MGTTLKPSSSFFQRADTLTLRPVSSIQIHRLGFSKGQSFVVMLIYLLEYFLAGMHLCWPIIHGEAFHIQTQMIPWHSWSGLLATECPTNVHPRWKAAEFLSEVESKRLIETRQLSNFKGCNGTKPRGQCRIPLRRREEVGVQRKRRATKCTFSFDDCYRRLQSAVTPLRPFVCPGYLL